MASQVCVHMRLSLASCNRTPLSLHLLHSAFLVGIFMILVYVVVGGFTQMKRHSDEVDSSDREMVRARSGYSIICIRHKPNGAIEIPAM